MPRWLRIALIAVPLVAGGVAVAFLTSSRSSAPDAIEASGPMPRLQGAVLTEDRLKPPVTRVDPSLYRGEVVMVNFWASWCGPCRREQPGLERLWDRYRGRGVRFIGVNFRDDRAAARAYVKEFRVTYPSVVDRSGILAYRFGIPYLPATVLVGTDGTMRYRLVGAQAEEVVDRYLRQLRAE